MSKPFLYSIMNEDPEPLTTLRSGVPMELERIVIKALQKNPDDRYQRFDELLVDLNTLQKHSEIRFRGPVQSVRSSNPFRKPGRQR